MFKMWLNSPKEKSGLEGFDMERALKKIPTKELSILTFTKLQEHLNTCAENSLATLKVLKFVGWVVGMLALEKLNEIYPVLKHLPALGG